MLPFVLGFLGSQRRVCRAVRPSQLALRRPSRWPGVDPPRALLPLLSGGERVRRFSSPPHIPAERQGRSCC